MSIDPTTANPAGRRCLTGMLCPASCVKPCQRARQIAYEDAHQIPGWYHHAGGDEVFVSVNEGLQDLDGGFTRSHDRRFWLLWNMADCEGVVGSRYFRLPHWLVVRAVTDDFGELVRVDAA